MKAFTLIAFLLLTMAVSCHEKTEFKVRRVIANKSSVSVIVVAYENGDTIESISIPNGEMHEKNEICESERGNTFCDQLSGLDIRWDKEADSVSVIFEQQKRNSYCGFISNCTFDERNLILFPLYRDDDRNNSGYVKTIEGDTQVFTFTITEEDYENAEPIGG